MLYKQMNTCLYVYSKKRKNLFLAEPSDRCFMLLPLSHFLLRSI